VDVIAKTEMNATVKIRILNTGVHFPIIVLLYSRYSCNLIQYRAINPNTTLNETPRHEVVLGKLRFGSIHS